MTDRPHLFYRQLVDARWRLTLLTTLCIGGPTGCEGHGVVKELEPFISSASSHAAALRLAAPPRPTLVTLATQVAQRIKPSTATRCPANMLLVEGNYCPEVQQRCLRYLDPPGRYHEFRCAEYAPSVCVAKRRVPLRFCIDRDEYTEPGEHLPANHRSFSHASELCRAQGKRVCFESEWNFACEGEEMRPYPYGFRRDSTACNADNQDVVSPAGTLRDLRAPGGAFPRCVSPFGVRDMSGNLEEFVAVDGSRPVRPAMKGAYWQPSHNACRAAQTAHDRYYNGTETGFRCCADVPPE